LCDGVSGDEVDQEEDQAYYQPDYWEGVEDALEEEFQNQWPVGICQLPVLGAVSSVAVALKGTAGPSTSQLAPFGTELLRSG
jgi:hypothetical protein